MEGKVITVLGEELPGVLFAILIEKRIHVEAVGEDHTHGSEGDGKEDVADGHDVHHHRVAVDLLLRHEGPGEALRDPVDWEEEDEEALRPKEVGAEARAEGGASREMEEDIRVREPEKDDNQT